MRTKSLSTFHNPQAPLRINVSRIACKRGGCHEQSNIVIGPSAGVKALVDIDMAVHATSEAAVALWVMNRQPVGGRGQQSKAREGRQRQNHDCHVRARKGVKGATVTKENRQRRE